MAQQEEEAIFLFGVPQKAWREEDGETKGCLYEGTREELRWATTFKMSSTAGASLGFKLHVGRSMNRSIRREEMHRGSIRSLTRGTGEKREREELQLRGSIETGTHVFEAHEKHQDMF